MYRILVLLVLGVSAAASPAAAQPLPARILVVPFENARNEARLHWMGEASAVLLADGLRARGLAAIPRGERVRAFEQLRLPLSGALTRATVIKVGQLVGAAEVIVGSFSIEGNHLIIRAHAIQVDIGRLQPEITERGELTQLFEIYERLARRFSRDSAPVSSSSEHPSLEAFEYYAKGLVAESPSTRASFLEAAIREHPEFDRARLALWEVRYDQGDHEAGLAAVQAVAASSRLYRRARFLGGISLLELQRYDEAFDALKRLLDEGIPGSSAAVLNNIGVVQIRRGATPHSGTATYYLTKAAEADPDPDYLFNLGYAYVTEGNHQGALYWLREALRRVPGDADAHFTLAAALQATGNPTEAARERDLARRLSGRYEALDRQGSLEKVALPRGLERLTTEMDSSRGLRADQVVMTSAHREQRELASFHLESGRRLFDREQDREALAEVRRAVYLSPYEAEAHLLIARIHLRAGRPDEAVEALKIAIWSEDTAEARLVLADAYLRTGDIAAARAEAERALVLEPESEEAKRLLAEIERRQ